MNPKPSPVFVEEDDGVQNVVQNCYYYYIYINDNMYLA